jgi:hypothetical protein
MHPSPPGIAGETNAISEGYVICDDLRGQQVDVVTAAAWWFHFHQRQIRRSSRDNGRII